MGMGGQLLDEVRESTGAHLKNSVRSYELRSTYSIIVRSTASFYAERLVPISDANTPTYQQSADFASSVPCRPSHCIVRERDHQRLLWRWKKVRESITHCIGGNYNGEVCVSPWRAIWHSGPRGTNNKELSLVLRTNHIMAVSPGL